MSEDQSVPERELAANPGMSLRKQLLRAALDCSGGDLAKIFTAEDLLLAAWKRDPVAWGLRGHEKNHPNSEKIYIVIDNVAIKGKNLKGGLVSLGWLEKVRPRTYRLTTVGLALAAELEGVDESIRGSAERSLADKLGELLSHAVFIDWVRDHNKPKYFRDAGHFWGIAPGTPQTVIRNRITQIDNILRKAKEILQAKGVNEIVSRQGKILYQFEDIIRIEEFIKTLKDRFARDLSTLGVDLELEA